VNATTVGFTFLLAILTMSSFLKLRFTVVTCIAATAAYDYCFLPPTGSFNINDSQDWVALCSFLVTALIGTKLAAALRTKAEEATCRRLEVERLYTLSRRLLSPGHPLDLFKMIPRHVAESLGFESAALYLIEGDKVFCSQTNPGALNIEELRAAAYFAHPQMNDNGNISLTPIRLGTRVYGSLALFSRVLSRESIDAAAALAAVAIARACALEQVAKIEAARESERLKSVLLDAITHDFRTPLTSIKISATGLLEDLDFDRVQRKELLLIIDEECDRISRLVGEAAEMARLECGNVKLETASHTVGELVSTALSHGRNVTCNREIRVDLKQPERQLSVDLHLAAKALFHLISNAHLYSSPGQPIDITMDEQDGFVSVSVCDHGPGIDRTELDSIFEKFYRGKTQRYCVQGTGMGLPIAKAIAEAHGGTMTASSRLGNGSVFTFSLPLE
jgi:two-component system sensor histidine kinase KdpD